MSRSLRSTSLMLLLSAFAPTVLSQSSNPCKSFGRDFQNNGTYFQNVKSSDPFTFVEYFEGCQPDTAQNILVDPKGNQVQCSDTQLTPDDQNMLGQCPTLKNQLFSGEWSIVVLSNNGNAQPIAYQRDFSLIVGTQSTATYTPTVYVPTTTTPISTSTKYITDTSTTQAPPSTVTKPSTTITPTYTLTPARVTTTSTQALFTVTLTAITVNVGVSTVYTTASCTIPPLGKLDHLANILPTIKGVSAKAMATKASAKLRMLKDRDVDALGDIEEFLAKRHERLREHAKRAPDAMTTTVTETNSSLFKTATTTVIGSTISVTVSATLQTTITVTPPPVTVPSGRTTAAAVTTTAPTPTRTLVSYIISTKWVTVTLGQPITVTVKTTPSAVYTSCRAAGGFLY